MKHRPASGITHEMCRSGAPCSCVWPSASRRSVTAPFRNCCSAAARVKSSRQGWAGESERARAAGRRSACAPCAAAHSSPGCNPWPTWLLLPLPLASSLWRRRHGRCRLHWRLPCRRCIVWGQLALSEQVAQLLLLLLVALRRCQLVHFFVVVATEPQRLQLVSGGGTGRGWCERRRRRRRGNDRPESGLPAGPRFRLPF